VQNADFRDITKQILTVSLDQHWKIMTLSCAMLPSGLRPSGNITQLRGIIFHCYMTIQNTRSWLVLHASR